MGAAELRQVSCPECGQLFSPRGLGGHRRLQHGAAPRAALPAKFEPEPEALNGILQAIAGLQGSIERIETQLHSPEHVIARRETAQEQVQRLEVELTRLLDQLRNVNILRSDSQISHLRREQARLVFRLEELRRGEPRDDSYLT